MTIEVDLPDGSTAEFPDGMSAAEIEAVLRRQFPPAPSAMQPAADLSSGVVRGAANLLDFVGTPIHAGLNVAGIPTSENPTLATLNRLGLGLPAQSDSGQFLQRVGEDVGASAIPTAGLLGAARASVQATGLLGSAIQGARTAPAAFAGAELAAATGSGVGAATAERLAPESPAAEVAGQSHRRALAHSGHRRCQGRHTRRSCRWRADMRRTIETFRRAGTTPTVGQASGRKSLQGLERILEALPGGAGPIARRAEETARELGDQVQRVADQLSVRSGPDVAGRAIEKGLRGGFRNRTAVTSERLFGKLDDLIPPSREIRATKTLKFVEELASPIPNAPRLTEELRNPRINAIAAAFAGDVAEAGVVRYDTLKAVRSRVGKLLGNRTLEPDLDRAELKRFCCENAARAKHA